MQVIEDDVVPQIGYDDGDDQEESQSAGKLREDAAVPDEQHFEPVQFFADDHSLLKIGIFGGTRRGVRIDLGG